MGDISISEKRTAYTFKVEVGKGAGYLGEIGKPVREYRSRGQSATEQENLKTFTLCLFGGGATGRSLN
jgi:predicted glycosyltransferase